MSVAAAAPALEAPMTDLEKAYAAINHTELAGLGFIGGRSTVWTVDELIILYAEYKNDGAPVVWSGTDLANRIQHKLAGSKTLKQITGYWHNWMLRFAIPLFDFFNNGLFNPDAPLMPPNVMRGSSAKRAAAALATGSAAANDPSRPLAPRRPGRPPAAGRPPAFPRPSNPSGGPGAGPVSAGFIRSPMLPGVGRTAEPEKKKSRVGTDFQATVPGVMLGAVDGTDEAAEYMSAMPKRISDPRMVWSASECGLAGLAPEKLHEFVRVAQSISEHGHSMEQIMGILHWNHYDTQAALQDLSAYCVHPEVKPSWSPEEVAIFESGYSINGKNFGRVARMLPDKTTPDVVQFYYKWKKTFRINKRMQQYAIPVAESFGDSPNPQHNDDSFRDQQFLARRHRRAMLKVPAGSVCTNCESIDSSDEWRTRPADIAHLCLVCGEFRKLWGRDRVVEGGVTFQPHGAGGTTNSFGTASSIIADKLGNLELADLTRALAARPSPSPSPSPSPNPPGSIEGTNGANGVEETADNRNGDAGGTAGLSTTLGTSTTALSQHGHSTAGLLTLGTSSTTSGSGSKSVLVAPMTQLQAQIFGELSAAQKTLMEQDRDYLMLKRQQLDQATRMGLIPENPRRDTLTPTFAVPVAKPGPGQKGYNPAGKGSIWDDDDIAIVRKGLRMFGKNFEQIALMLNGTKSDKQVRGFWYNYRRKIGLEADFNHYLNADGNDDAGDTHMAELEPNAAHGSAPAAAPTAAAMRAPVHAPAPAVAAVVAPPAPATAAAVMTHAAQRSMMTSTLPAPPKVVVGPVVAAPPVVQVPVPAVVPYQASTAIDPAIAMAMAPPGVPTFIGTFTGTGLVAMDDGSGGATSLPAMPTAAAGQSGAT